jgi:hypothetical protein
MSFNTSAIGASSEIAPRLSKTSITRSPIGSWTSRPVFQSSNRTSLILPSIIGWHFPDTIPERTKRTPILAFKSNGQSALEWDPLSAPKKGSDVFLVQFLFIGRLSAQPKAIDFAVAVHRLTSLRRVIFPSVRPLDQGKMIAARAATSSFITPRANDATGLARARPILDDNPVAAPLTALAA